MSERRDELVRAFSDNDHAAVRSLGWWDVWQALHTWWSPKQTCPARDVAPYAALLHSEEPATILSALEALAGEWRPTPAAVRGHLHSADEVAVNVGRGRDPHAAPAVLAAVTAALAAGEQACDHAWGPSRFRPDALGVLRCRECRGIELGQVYAAEDDRDAREAA